MKKTKQVRLYLSPRPAPNRGKYEVYVDGETTGLLVGLNEIRKILSYDQYRDFTRGFEIFMVPKGNIKTKGNGVNKRQITGL